MLSRAARPALRAAAAAPSRVTASAPINAATFATLREIEGRLKSIRNIEKITKTMKIVASTKLNRAQKAMTDSRVYGATSNEVFDSAETKPLEGEGKKELIIICSSDKGLCGGIHSGLSRTIRRQFAEKETTADLVILGEKCKAQLQRTNAKDIRLNFAGVGKDVPTFADAQAIADQIVQLSGDYSSIKILYNKFINATSYEPTIIEAFSEEAIAASRKLTPSTLAECSSYSNQFLAANFSAFEVDEEVLPNLREYALANSIYWALAEGHACEISARRNAMDNASKNAGDMINKYQILFNRTRQAVITGELVEIITGATASEDM
ncbi:ATP synthase subunit gamma [Colletotrichum higginsianum]|nr:ATP synthase subunit gamma [Colletotrichum higginsianum]